MAIRKRQVLLAAAAGTAVIFLTGLFFGGFESVSKYFSLLWNMNLKGGGFGLNILDQPTLKGALFWMFSRFYNPPTIATGWIFLILITLLICLKYWSGLNRKSIDSGL